MAFVLFLVSVSLEKMRRMNKIPVPLPHVFRCHADRSSCLLAQTAPSNVL